MTNSRNAQRSPGTTPASSVHTIKVTLGGSRPPIWRRLEVPSASTLLGLHHIVQRAFGWDGYHLWVFTTPLGKYGVADPDLGHNSAVSRRLFDVAPHTGDRFHYIYDFGDDWKHDILVEGVTDAGPGIAYPRCIAGSRACPPEDCGGMWGYAELLDILSDPGHEEHNERLGWLGIDSPDQFDPAAFDAACVTIALSDLETVLVKS
jgi:Plasmid pRiA4b ORF-3-like protein